MKDDLSPELRALLEKGSEGPPLSEAARARVLGRVLPTVAVSATAAAAAGAAKAGATASAAATTKVAAAGGGVVAAGSATLSAVVVKGAIGVALAASAVGGGAWVLRERLASQTAVAVVDQAAEAMAQAKGPSARNPAATETLLELDLGKVPSTMSPSSLSQPPLRAPTGASSPPPGRSAPAQRPSVAVSSETAVSAPAADTRTAESALLQHARTALASGDPSKALSILEDHAQSYAAGLLVEERDGLRVVALARAGRTDEARASAAAFAARYPHSLLLPTVEATVRP